MFFFTDCPGLSENSHLEYLQEQTLQMLFDYCSSKSEARFGKLLLLLPYVSSLNKICIQDIFFKKTVGNVPIENVITEMIRHGMLIWMIFSERSLKLMKVFRQKHNRFSDRNSKGNYRFSDRNNAGFQQQQKITHACRSRRYLVFS